MSRKMEFFMEKFNKRLRICRENAKLTQEDTAHALGIRYSTYRRYEAGGTEPNISLAAQIAEYFHVSLDYLAGLTDEPTA